LAWHSFRGLALPFGTGSHGSLILPAGKLDDFCEESLSANVLPAIATVLGSSSSDKVKVCEHVGVLFGGFFSVLTFARPSN
jgi:hypothetical protein